MNKKKCETFWIVVEVWRGIPVQVEAYRKIRDAQVREKALRVNINPVDDETSIFKVIVQE